MFIALLVLIGLSFLIQIPKVAEFVAPMLKIEQSKLIFYGEVAHTWAVAFFFFWLAFITMSALPVAILFAIAGISIAYHALRKFN